MCLNVLKNDIKHILRQKQTGFFCKHKKAALSTIKLFHVFLMYYYATIAQSLSDQISSTVASGRDAPALRSSKLTNPTLLQYLRHIKARVDCADKQL